MFDTHAHLEMINDDLPASLSRAKDATIDRILTIGTSASANAFVLDAVKQAPGTVFGAIAYDRDQANSNIASMVEELRTLVAANRESIVAIGETGLDFHYLSETAAQQTELFEAQLALAAENALPTIVHSREAESETLACLKKAATSRPGVIHCFTGSMDFARRAIDLGFMISFSGILTFKNANALREVAKALPEDMILVETDSPYLTPEPHRGTKNEPAFLPHVVRTLAELRGKSPEDMAQITTMNACTTFGIEL